MSVSNFTLNPDEMENHLRGENFNSKIFNKHFPGWFREKWKIYVPFSEQDYNLFVDTNCFAAPLPFYHWKLFEYNGSHLVMHCANIDLIMKGFRGVYKLNRKISYSPTQLEKIMLDLNNLVEWSAVYEEGISIYFNNHISTLVMMLAPPKFSLKKERLNKNVLINVEYISDFLD